MAVKVGSLEIDLRANSAQFIQGMERARGSMSGFVGQFGKLQSLLIGGAGVAGFGVAIKGAVDFANNLGDLNTRLGFSTEFLSQMKFAAETSGVGFGTLTTSMQRFTRRLAEAQQGSGVLVDALDQLGLDADELVSLGADEAFLAWADALSKVEDPGLRAALAMKGMDTEGVALTQVLAGGAAGIREMTEEADRLGLTITGETAAAATQFNFQLERMKAAGTGVVRQFTAGLLPAMADLAESANTVGGAFDIARQIGTAFGNALNGIRIAAKAVVLAVRDTAENLLSFNRSVAKALVFDFSGAAKEREDFAERQRQRTLDFLEEAERLSGTAPKTQDFFPAPFRPPPAQSPADLAAKPGGSGRLDPAQTEMELAQRRALADAQRLQNQLTAEGARIFAATRTPAEELAATQERLNDLLKLGAIDQDTFNRAVLESQDRFRQATDALKENQQASVEFMDEHVALWEEQQAAIARTQEETQRALFGSLESGLKGLVQGTTTARQAFASMTADILSQLAKIAAQDAFGKIFNSGGATSGGGVGAFFSNIVSGLFGAQNGASFSVGGTGGADSQVVAFRATPGEQVQVGGGAGAPITVVQNMSFASGPTDRQTLDQVGFQAGEAIRQAMARNG